MSLELQINEMLVMIISRFISIYTNFNHSKVSRSAWDTNLVAANPLFISVNLEASGGLILIFLIFISYKKKLIFFEKKVKQ